MRSWFLSLLEIVVVGKVFAEVYIVYQFKLSIQYLEVFIWKSLSGKENDDYAVNKIRGEVFHDLAIIGLNGSFILGEIGTGNTNH